VREELVEEQQEALGVMERKDKKLVELQAAIQTLQTT